MSDRTDVHTPPLPPMTTTSGRLVGFALTAGVLMVVMVGGTLPIPLYVLYEPKMGFGTLGVTIVFAAYVIGTLGSLLAFGDLSDHLGRKKVLALALVFAAMSTVMFLVATNVGELIAARVLSGVGAGFATGTATAALAELQPRGNLRVAAVVAAGANMIGLGLGPLIAGLFAQYLPMPTRTVFWAYLGLNVLASFALVAVPETVRDKGQPFRLRLHIGVPARGRLVMLGAMLGVFAAFTLLGLFSSLVPSFLRGILGIGNLAIIGAASFLVFLTAALSQALSAQLSSRRAVSVGLPVLLVGLTALETSLFSGTSWLFLAGTVASGIAVGLVFRGGLGEIGRLVAHARRAEAMSAFFAAAYLGLGLPVVLIGLLSQLISTVDASAYVAGLVATVILAAAVMVIYAFGKAARPANDVEPTHPSAPDTGDDTDAPARPVVTDQRASLSQT